MKNKKYKNKNIKEIQRPEMPSAVDDAADVMSKYSSKRNKSPLKEKKHSFPPID